MKGIETRTYYARRSGRKIRIDRVGARCSVIIMVNDTAIYGIPSSK